MAGLSSSVLSAIGKSEKVGPLTVYRQDICKYSIATGQQSPTYLRGDEAPPLFFMSLSWALHALQHLADDGLADDPFTEELPAGKRMGGGMRVEPIRPIRPGDILTAVRTIADIYEKQGTTGRLLFYDIMIEIRDSQDELVLRCSDKRIIR